MEHSQNIYRIQRRPVGVLLQPVGRCWQPVIRDKVAALRVAQHARTGSTDLSIPEHPLRVIFKGNDLIQMRLNRHSRSFHDPFA
jgi:hypothetical protein